MLALATLMLGLGVALGAAAAVPRLGRSERAPPWWLAAVHGGVALAGLALLLLVLPGARRGAASGAQSFGAIAALLLAAAALVGVSMLALHWRKRRVAGPLVGLHATLAVGGFVILVVYVLLG
jgi:hypothetical protein